MANAANPTNAVAQLIQPTTAIVTAIVSIREWTRRDRRHVQAWPASELPVHWGWVNLDNSGLPRTSYAIDAGGQLVGRITLRNNFAGSARVGIYLDPREYGRGYGSTALRMLNGFARGLGIKQLWADVAADNQRSRRAFAKAGYHCVGSYDALGERFSELLVRL
jgi:RimJ/RimL family protein N-acetyltransferase